MPHLRIEYSEGAETHIEALCAATHQAMVDAGIFPLAGIRVRAYRADHAIVADGLAENAFVAMTLSVGAGRSTDVLKTAGDTVFAAGRAALADLLSTEHFAFSLEIREIHPDLTWKDTPIHARLSGKS